MESTPTAAFFDVDETVIRVKSMFEFLRYWMAVQGDDGTAYEAAQGELRAMAESGIHRTQINRRYYEHFRGVPVTEVEAAGAAWYADYRQGPEAFVTAALDALAGHRRDGDVIVLVSGSFLPVLGPVARDLGADHVLCTVPLVGDDGCYTGEVERPMIGPNKAGAVAGFLAGRGLAPGGSHCYADHGSDLEMLNVVGNPSVVGDDPVLRAEAARHGWPVLDAAPGPRQRPAPAAPTPS